MLRLINTPKMIAGRVKIKLLTINKVKEIFHKIDQILIDDDYTSRVLTAILGIVIEPCVPCYSPKYGDESMWFDYEKTPDGDNFEFKLLKYYE